MDVAFAAAMKEEKSINIRNQNQVVKADKKDTVKDAKGFKSSTENVSAAVKSVTTTTGTAETPIIAEAPAVEERMKALLTTSTDGVEFITKRKRKTCIDELTIHDAGDDKIVKKKKSLAHIRFETAATDNEDKENVIIGGKHSVVMNSQTNSIPENSVTKIKAEIDAAKKAKKEQRQEEKTFEYGKRLTNSYLGKLLEKILKKKS
jgi:hypothetical protein